MAPGQMHQPGQEKRKVLAAQRICLRNQAAKDTFPLHDFKNQPDMKPLAISEDPLEHHTDEGP